FGFGRLLGHVSPRAIGIRCGKRYCGVQASVESPAGLVNHSCLRIFPGKQGISPEAARAYAASEGAGKTGFSVLFHDPQSRIKNPECPWRPPKEAIACPASPRPPCS